jgi:putative oxidoreductase
MTAKRLIGKISADNLKEVFMLVLIKAISNFIGRIIISSIFIFSAKGILTNFSGTVTFTKAAGITIGTEFLVAAAVIMEIIGILSLITGYKVEIGSLALLIFIIPVTFIFHQFWKLSGQEAMTQLGYFFSDLGLTAGILILLSSGAGPISLEKLIKRIQLK